MLTFQEIGLQPNILKALNELNYISPTEIQQKAIPQLLTSKQDLKAFAQTGTGKTAAFSLPIIEQVEIENKNVQAIILSPTRELTIQIAKNIKEYCKFYPEIKTLAVYGGASIEDQIRKLKRGIHIIVGTPGRTVDLIKRKQLQLNQIKWLVLDEADEMLNMGFKEELDQVVNAIPSKKQTLLFSATFPKEVEAIAKKYLQNPLEITSGKKNEGSDNVSHQYYVVSSRNRYAALKRIADINPAIYGIVFCRTRRETQEIADQLIKDGYSADALHGDLSQAQRDTVMGKFRQKHLQILVATDVAARGLDVNDLTHVINYKLPDQTEAYTHRSGRTGRAGKTGISIAIVTTKERNKLRPIEKIIGKNFEKTPIPTGKEICQNQLFHLIDRVHDIEINEQEIEEFLPEVYKKLEKLNREELIKRFVSMEFNQFLSYYENAPDLNDSQHMTSNGNRGNRENMSRFFINIGRRDKLNPARLIGLINDQNIAKNIEIGQIEILDSFSFFELDKNYEKEALIAFEINNASFEGRSVNVEITENKKTDRRKKRRSNSSSKNKIDISKFNKRKGKNTGGFGNRKSRRKRKR